MVKWTVLVKTQQETQPVVLEADFVEPSENGRVIHFYALGPVAEAYRSFNRLKPDSTDEERLELFRGFVHALSRFEVGAFKADVVDGYFQGEESTPG